MMEISKPSVDSSLIASMRLVLSPSMCIEQIDDTAATIYLRSTGSRIRIPRSLYNILLLFDKPTSVRSVVGPTDLDSRMIKAIANLNAKGFLITKGDLKSAVGHRRTMYAPVRLFDCPAQKLAPAQADVVILGVPYDLSDRSSAGARNAPAAIRETSLQMLYGIDKKTGRPRGWYDVDRGKMILQGVVISDCGDIYVEYGECQSDLFKRIAEVLGEVTYVGVLPLLLGGDASISFPAIEVLQSREPLAVLRIGRLSAAERENGIAAVTPSSLPDRALSLPNVTQYLHVGALDVAFQEMERTLRGFNCVSVPEVKDSGISIIKDNLHDKQNIYISLDMNSLELPNLPATDDCFEYADIHSILCDIGSTYSIVGLDLVGLNPSKNYWRATSMTAVHILLTALSAAEDQHDGCT